MMSVCLAAVLALSAGPAGPGRPVRVLVWANGPIRESQFLRMLLEREMDMKRAETTVVMQPVPGKPEPKKGETRSGPFRALTRFPDKFSAAGKGDGAFDLGTYDVVIAFDPDWSRLKEGQVKGLAKWVRSGGGLILVAGPMNTPKLADADGLDAVREILPVALGDRADTRDTGRPWALTFPKAKERPPFMKLDPKGKGELAGWEEFFREEKAGPARGFYQAHPVKEVKKGAVVLATFGDPKAKMGDGSLRPYLASREAGKGRVYFIGSAELWRLREYRPAAHERLWGGLITAARAKAD
jgi:hypothetical protein